MTRFLTLSGRVPIIFDLDLETVESARTFPSLPGRRNVVDARVYVYGPVTIDYCCDCREMWFGVDFCDQLIREKKIKFFTF